MPDESFIGGVSIPQHGEDDALQLLQEARNDGYDFITSKLPHASTVKRTDVTMIESKWWSTSIVGLVSSPPMYKKDVAMETSEADLEIDHGEDLVAALSCDDLARSAEKHLTYMTEWASHMNIPAVILPPIPKDNFVEYGRFLSTLALRSGANNVQLWLRVNFDKVSIQNFMVVHRICDGAANLGCIVDFNDETRKSEKISESLSLLHQLVGCNLRAAVFNTGIFLSNKRGFPTLAKTHQFLFIELMKRLGRTCRVLVEGNPCHQIPEDEEAIGKSGNKLYLQYLRHLRAKEEVKNVLDTEEGQMETGYLDHLQSALQPLGDNLEFSTYEVFEKDPVKYERYRQAVELALQDKIQLGHLRTEAVRSDSNNTIIHCNILVVGAGRGPLVNASLTAVKNVNENNRKVLGPVSTFTIQPRVVAVEKNPSAVLFLRSLQLRHSEWNSSVDIVECDMRTADRDPLLSKMISGGDSEKADIVVSELLGSFGDNELSPECLDGVQASGLMKETCVSIPQSYTSYLAPVTSMRLHSEAQAHAFFPSNGTEGPGGKPCGILHAMETPYVVRTHAASQIHEEKPCWAFSHPVRENGVNVKDSIENIDNERRSQTTFKIGSGKGAAFGCGYGNCDNKLAALTSRNNVLGSNCNTIHGFLGSFHCVLYESNRSESSVISIAPSSFSTGMFSWFPLYFPLREPLVVPPNASVRANIWRKCDSTKVWYEWCAEIIGDTVLSISHLHNPNGRSCFVRL